MKPDNWTFTKIQEVFENLEGTQLLSSLELLGGNWKVRLWECVKENATLIFRFGSVQLGFMPFGLMNSLSLFQWIMDFIFRDFHFVIVYLDDLVIFSNNLEDIHLGEVFTNIWEPSPKIQPRKRSFTKTIMEFLGHYVDSTGFYVVLKKV